MVGTAPTGPRELKFLSHDEIQHQRTCKQEGAKPAEFIKRTAAAKRRVCPRHRVLVSNLQLKRADAQANRRSCVLALRPRG
jgi:hypothetical protein